MLVHFVNAVLYPGGQTLTVENGRIVAIDGPAPPGADVVDLAGRWVGPGLIDTHTHLTEAAEAMAAPDLSGVDSRAAFEGAIERAAAALEPGAWLVARRWLEPAWGGELPTKEWLAAAGDRPAIAYRADLHAAVLNEAALARIDLDGAPDRVERDDAGVPTGLLVEGALWERANPVVPRPSTAARRAALGDAFAHLLERGVTAVGSMEYASTVRDVLLPEADSFPLRCRVTLLDRDWPLDLSVADLPASDALRIIGFKAFFDGTLGSRSAAMIEPYADAPGEHGLLVELATTPGRPLAWARHVAEHGWQPAIHAIGDAAVRVALEALAGTDPDVRPRIEHAQHVAPEDLARFRGLIASMQPLHLVGDAEVAPDRLGPARLSRGFPFSALADAGATLAFGSDWPIVDCCPIAGIRAAVCGDPVFPAARCTIDAAIEAYTAGAAWALFLDDAGRIEVGRRADLVVLDRDPRHVDWTGAPPVVTMTIVNGKVVYER